jgi:siroheme synthase-like protein
VSALFPVFLRLEGRDVLVVGGGPVAAEKARFFLRAGARVHVVAPATSIGIEEAADHARVRVSRRGFEEADADGAWLIVAAATPEVNRLARAAGDARRVFVIAADDPAVCSAFGAARFEKGGVTVALSSGGRAPGLVALLREALEAVIPDDAAEWMRVAESARAAWREERVPIARRKPLLLRALRDLYEHREGA